VLLTYCYSLTPLTPYLAQKLTVNEYVNMTGDTKGGTEGHDDDPQQDDGHDSGVKDGFDEAKRKRVMNRLLTGRLDKLVDKKDDTCVQSLLLSSLIFELTLHAFSGNVLSNDFMELPNKKIWAIYYKTIPRPMSFEKIYVRHITLGSDIDGPFPRNTLSGRSIRMLLNLRRTSS
jgi:hypothetical protein